MAEEKTPETIDIEKIKSALVGAGVIKSTTLSAADEAKIREELARHHIDALRFPFRIICHSGHYCLIVKGIN
jgi:hypothetical protein